MLVESLLANAARAPGDIAIEDDGGVYTHLQMAQMASGLAALITEQTNKPHVGMLLPSSAAFVAGFYGILLAGKTVVPINFLISDREITHVLKDSGVDTVLTITPLVGKLKDTGLKIIDLLQIPKTAPAALATPPKKNPDDLAVIMYTSGTSGLPKGVMLTYTNLQADTESAIAHAFLEGKHNFLGIIPLFHSTGMLATMLAPVTLGSRTVYMARFSPVAVMKAIREHAISVVAAVPSMYGALIRLKNAGPEDVKTLYLAISGGEPLASNIREAFVQKFQKPIMEGYGLTETIGPVAFNTPHQHKPGSVGRIIPHVEVKITDDDGNVAKPTEPGEIWLKGAMITRGYYNLPEATANTITPDGYFKTGDLGRIDDEGYLHITGRKKDLIISAGEKISPAQIEERLLLEPTIQEAAVVGKKDPSRGEVVVAFVIAKDGKEIKVDAVKEFCRSQGMAQWQIPREIFIVKDLPRTPTGKVLKRVLSDQVNQGAGV